MSVRILDFKLQRKGSLVGFADVEMQSGLQIFGITIFQGKDGLVAFPPGKPQIDTSGRVIRKEGKTQYAAVIKFKSKEVKANWSRQIVAALEASHASELAS